MLARAASGARTVWRLGVLNVEDWAKTGELGPELPGMIDARDASVVAASGMA